MDKDKCLDIFERYILRQATNDEIESLCSFINNDHYLNQWLEEQIMNSSSDIDLNLKLRMLDNIRSNTQYQVENNFRKNVKKTNKNYIQWVANIAAILLPIVLIAGIYMFSRPQKIDHLTISAGLGEKASVSLPDGSKISINSESEVVYSTEYNKEDRCLKLKGEGYFDVEPNLKKPFIVECGDIKIKVLGTTFGIKAYDDENSISVVLNTGKVEFISPNETFEMAPNERVIYDKTKKNTKKYKVDAEDYIDWRKNRLRFENETLEYIIKTISRMHNTDIVFKDKQLADQKFTGTIDNVSVKSALKALSLTAPLSYYVENGVVYLYQDKDKTQYFK